MNDPMLSVNLSTLILINYLSFKVPWITHTGPSTAISQPPDLVNSIDEYRVKSLI